MPIRMLRDWTTSEAVDRLTAEQENAFTRLIMAVDDFGRYHADPRLLLARLYPLRVGSTSAQQMRSIRDALAEHMLITCYAVEGREFLEIRKWNNVPRAKESKFPANDHNAQRLHSTCTAHARQMRSTCTASAPETETETETVTEDRKPHTGAVASQAACVASPFSKRRRKKDTAEQPHYTPEFLAAYESWPKKVSKAESFGLFQIAAKSIGFAKLLDCIRADVIRHGRDWTKDGFQFCPAMPVWLRNRRWEDVLDASGNVAFPTTNEGMHDEFADTF